MSTINKDKGSAVAKLIFAFIAGVIMMAVYMMVMKVIDSVRDSKVVEEYGVQVDDQFNPASKTRDDRVSREQEKRSGARR